MPHSPGLLNDFCVIYYVCKYFRRLAVSSSITLTLSGFQHNSRFLRRSFFFSILTALCYISHIWWGDVFNNWHFILFFQLVVSSFLGLPPRLFLSATQFLRKRRNQRISVYAEESTNKSVLVFPIKNLINPSVCHATSSMPYAVV